MRNKLFIVDGGGGIEARGENYRSDREAAIGKRLSYCRFSGWIGRKHFLNVRLDLFDSPFMFVLSGVSRKPTETCLSVSPSCLYPL